MARAVPWHQSLAWKIFLSTALTIAGGLALVLWVAQVQSRKQAFASAVAGIHMGSQVIGQSMESQARAMDAGLEVFTTYQKNLAGIENQDFQQVRESLLNNLSGLNSDVAMVIRPSGALLSCTTDGYKQDYSDVGIVERARDAHEAEAGHERAAAYKGFFQIGGGAYQGSYLGVARRLVNARGDFLGVMMVANRLTDRTAQQLRAQSIVKARDTDPWSHVTLIAGDGILGSTLGDPRERERLGAWLAGHPAGGDPGSGPASLRLEGNEQLAMRVPMEGIRSGGQPIAALITVPLDPYLRPFRIIQRAILGIGVVALLLALLAALQTARAVTAPLSRLTRTIKALAEGERPELPAAGERGEVAALTRGFRFLLSELKAKEDLLLTLNEIRGGQVSRDFPSQVEIPFAGDETRALPMGRPGTTPSTYPAGPPARVLRPGDTLSGRYSIERILGEGGMGIVLKAHDQQLDEEVAIKVIRPEFGANPAFLEPLKQEIKLARRISHRHVLRIHDFGESEGLPFVTMEFLKGVTLRTLLDEKVRLPLPQVLRIGRQIAEGLEAAHAQGVVHRDIKPLNVMFDTKGDVKLLDFGLAAPVRARGMDATGHVLGTPKYMAPEQFRGEEVDPRTDFYALGVVLFELSTGFPPFEGEDPLKLAGLHLNAPPPDPRTYNQALPDGFRILLRSLLAKEKKDRPDTAQDVLALLHQVSGDGATAA